MKKLLLVTLMVIALAAPAFAVDGMVNVKSSYGVEATGDRLEKILEAKGMTLLNRIRHSEEAQKVGIELNDTELFIFGNPKVGSPIMKCQQSVAIDLPQKMLIWKDDAGTVWVSYNDPGYLVQRHDITGCDAVITKVGKALAGISKAAASK